MNLYTPYLDYLRTGLVLVMLGYGSYRDLKTREIHDILWLVFGGIGFILDIYELFIGTLKLQQFLFSIGFIVIVGAVLGFLRLFGDADLLALIALVIIQPKPPFYITSNWGWQPIFFPLTIITNTAIAGIITPFIIFSMNLIVILNGLKLWDNLHSMPILRKVVLIFTALNMRIDQVRGPPFHYPLEDPVSGKVSLSPDIRDDNKAYAVLRGLREKGLERIWVSWTLPYVLIITFGYVLSIVFGDLLLWVFTLFM